MKVLSLPIIKIKCNNISKLDKSLDKFKKRDAFKLEDIKKFDTKENTGQKINYICSISKNRRGASYEDIDYNTATLKPNKSETVHISGLDEWFRYNNVLECVRYSGHFSNYRYDDIYSMKQFKKRRTPIMPISAYKLEENYVWRIQ